MGHIFAELELSNPRRTDFVPVRVIALRAQGRGEGVPVAVTMA